MTTDKLYPTDILTRRERVERTLNHRPVDRVALHEQLSYNPGVIADVTGRSVRDFGYSYYDICETIRLTLDACFPPVAPLGVECIVDADGFTIQQDNWHSSIVARPFTDVPGARDYLLQKTAEMRRHGRSGGYGFPPGIMPDEGAAHPGFDPDRERAHYRAYMQGLQARIGDTVIIDFTIQTGFCECWSRLGLDTFIYLYDEAPEVISDYIQTYTDCELRRLHAVADPALSPVVLIAEDFASKRGPIFSPAFLRRELFPHVHRLTEAWHTHGLKVLYHSDGNWRSVIPDLIACGVDGFYCLEPALGMDIVGLKRAWPAMTWAGGVDGVELMERGTPTQVCAEVRRQITETDALNTGGLFIDTSSEINPLVKPENFAAMTAAVREFANSAFVV